MKELGVRRHQGSFWVKVECQILKKERVITSKEGARLNTAYGQH